MTFTTVLPAGASVGSKLPISTPNELCSPSADRHGLVQRIDHGRPAVLANERATPNETWIMGGKMGRSS